MSCGELRFGRESIRKAAGQTRGSWFLRRISQAFVLRSRRTLAYLVGRKISVEVRTDRRRETPREAEGCYPSDEKWRATFASFDASKYYLRGGLEGCSSGRRQRAGSWPSFWPPRSCAWPSKSPGTGTATPTKTSIAASAILLTPLSRICPKAVRWLPHPRFSGSLRIPISIRPST
jgi:hypothetical protein